MTIEKDGSKLFEDVPDSAYQNVCAVLLTLRAAFPSYRDDQLLTYLLCILAAGDPGCVADLHSAVLSVISDHNMLKLQGIL